MPEKRKAQVIVTREDGTQLVYHTNRRDALHQMMLGVGVLSTDRYALLPQSHKCLSHATCLPHKRILALSYAAKGVSLLHALSGALSCCGCYESADTQWCCGSPGWGSYWWCVFACSLRWMWAPKKAGAALLQFPTTSLRNNYYLVRDALDMQH